MNKIYQLILVCWVSCFGFAAAQDRVVSGRVTSSDDGSAVPGASILLKGTTKGATTDADGNFKIAVSANAVLVVSAIGFQAKNVEVGARTTVEVVLSADVRQLSEVVVTAFGIKQERKALGFSVQEVSGEMIKNTAEPNIVSALQGKIAGAIISGSGGAPGAGTNIILRGITSLSPGANNQPLFVIDGIVVSNFTNAGNVLPSVGSNSPASAEQFANTNRAGDINPDDIESMTVLKGAGATALYGQRAANGVIIITTKKGKSGQSVVNFGTQFGWDNVLKSPAIQTEYTQGFTGEWRDPANFRTRTVFWEWGPPRTANDPQYDNFRTFFKQGFRSTQDFSVSGGSDKATYYTSVSNFSQRGIVPNTDFRRTTVRLSGSTKVNDDFTVSGSINYVNSGGTRPTQGDKSIYSSLSFWSPSFDVNDYLNPDGSQKNITNGTVDNPRYFAENSTLKDKVNRVFGDLSFNYNITPWLTAKYQATLDYYNEGRNRFVPPNLDVGTQVRGFIVQESFNYREFNSNAFLTATKQFNENFKASLMVGNNVTDILATNLTARGEGFALQDFYDLSNTANYTARFTRPNSQRIVGVLGEAKLEYKNTVFLTVTGRNDWASTLPSDNRSFFYPAVNLGYVFTESLPWNRDILSFGKLRASWAQVGKAAPPYSVGTYFGATPGFPFGTTVGFRRDPIVGDPNLQPEKTTTKEFGLELAFLKGRVSLDATYFVMDSDKQIIEVPTANSTGFSRYITNAGLIQNRGIELLLNLNPLRTKAFRWDVAVNWARLRNEVKTMPAGISEITYYDQGRAALRIVQGGAMGDLYGYDFRRNANGDLLIQTTGFPRVDDSRYVKVGNAFPKWQGGITNTFSWKGFSLSFLLEWRQGGDVVDMGEINGIRNGITRMTGNRYETVVFKGVTAADGLTPNSQPVVIDQNFYRNLLDFNGSYLANIQDGSWFRVRNANLSYALPKNLLKKTPFSALRVNLTGNNLYLNTPFRGYDPESLTFGSGTNILGFVGRNTPATRSFNVGLNVTFK